MFIKKIGIGILTVCLGISYPSVGIAGPVWERIKNTGVITAGARTDAIPFGYINDQEEWVGYSLDMLELIRQQVEQELNKPITLELVEVDPVNRFDKIQDQSIDIECGSTTFTWEREKFVDFSVSYFGSGTQMIVRKGSNLETIPSLAGRRIGVIPETTNEEVIKTLQPEAQLVIVEDRLEGFAKLQAGEIEGFASDGIVLEGLRLTAANPDDYQIVPEYPYTLESYSCILPQDESEWRDIVNYALVKFMEGIVSDYSKSVAIYDRWFGTQGVTPYPQEKISDYFMGIINTYEWIPLPERY